MKQKVLVLLLVVNIFLSFPFLNKVYATVGQWSSNGTTMYYNDGKIGIGSSSPSDQLQVVTFGAGDSNGNGGTKTLFGDGSDSLWFNTVRNGSWDGSARIMMNGYFDGAWKKRNSDKGTWLINMSASSGDSSSFVIQHSAQTSGVNTISNWNPMLRIKGDGTVFVQKLIVTNPGGFWADYVFDEDYKLMPLSVLGNYVKENKHLPNVPAANEIQSEGLSVGDMQRVQMEKIEELTLYIIDLQKQVDGLKGELSSLKK